MSLCHNRNPDFEESRFNPNKIPDSEITTNSQDGQIEVNRGSMRRTKKKKTSMPKNFEFKDEEEEMSLSQNKKKDSSLDENKNEKKEDGNINKNKINIEEKSKVIEIINTDLPPKDNLVFDKNKNINNNEEKELVKNNEKDEVEMKVEIKDGEDIVIPQEEDEVEMKVEIKDGEDIVIPQEENNNEEEKISISTDKKVLLKKKKNENEEIKKEEKEINKNEVKEIKENEVKKEEEIKGNQEKKEEEKIENERKEEEKKEEEDEEGEENEEEEDKEVNSENNEKKEDQKENLEESEKKDLTKYDPLIKIINKNFESKGFSKFDINDKINELFKTLSDSTTTDELITKLSELFIELMDVTLDSDKKEILAFFKDIAIFFNGDIINIHEQLLSFIGGINDQSKLQNRSSNRVIRGYIKKCEKQLKERLKQEDIPSDKIVSFQKFEEIMNETGVELKEEHMDILLYQMKKKVPTGRSIDTLNMIVVIDFLK